MSFQSTSNNLPRLHIQLEILTEHANEAGVALVSAVGRDAIDELHMAGYIVQPVSTGQSVRNLSVQQRYR